MPEYVFEDPDGKIVEEFLHVNQAPPIGGYIVRDGVKLRRRATVPQGCVHKSIHFRSIQLPPWYKPHADAGGAFDHEGQPVFTSRKDLRETLACANDNDEQLAYD